MGFGMLAFQPAAFVGDHRRWHEPYRRMTDDDVWDEIERGIGAPLDHTLVQHGDLRCNRVAYGFWVGERWHPIADGDDPRDIAARDAFLRWFGPVNLIGSSAAVLLVKIARVVARHPRTVPITLGLGPTTAAGGRAARRAAARGPADVAGHALVHGRGRRRARVGGDAARRGRRRPGRARHPGAARGLPLHDGPPRGRLLWSRPASSTPCSTRARTRSCGACSRSSRSAADAPAARPTRSTSPGWCSPTCAAAPRSTSARWRARPCSWRSATGIDCPASTTWSRWPRGGRRRGRWWRSGSTAPRILGPLADHLGWSSAFLADHDRRLYARLGMRRAPWWRVWSPRTLAFYGRGAPRRAGAPSRRSGARWTCSRWAGDAVVVERRGRPAMAAADTGRPGRPRGGRGRGPGHERSSDREHVEHPEREDGERDRHHGVAAGRRFGRPSSAAGRPPGRPGSRDARCGAPRRARTATVRRRPTCTAR